MEAPREDHLAAVKRILRYVAGMKDRGIFYTKHTEGRRTLVRYTNADMAGDIDTRKSTNGVLFFFGGNPVTWQSTKQRIMAMSSCEAEYIAAAAGARQGVWLTQLVGDLTGEEAGAPELCINNQLTIALCKNPLFHDLP
jgi:hypothetical protein